MFYMGRSKAQMGRSKKQIGRFKRHLAFSTCILDNVYPGCCHLFGGQSGTPR